MAYLIDADVLIQLQSLRCTEQKYSRKQNPLQLKDSVGTEVESFAD